MIKDFVKILPMSMGISEQDRPYPFLLAGATLATYLTSTFSLICLGAITYYGDQSNKYHFQWRKAAFIKNRDKNLPALERQENHANKRWYQAVGLFGLSIFTTAILFNSVINMAP